MSAVIGRSSRFHRSMHPLAFIALALMLCMPVMGRWQQAHGGQAADALMCQSSDAHAHQHPADNGSPSKDDHHHDHDACGYCTLATRMLPVLAVVLSLPARSPVQHSGRITLPVAPPAPTWPAHSPRGPPLYS